MLGLGLGISRSGVIIRGVAFSPEYQAVLTEATTQGFNLPSAGQQVKQNTLMTSLVSSGVFAKLDTILVFANDGSKEFACINWKNPTGNKAILESSPIFTANQGFTGTQGAGNSWININYNPNGTLNYKLNDASRYVYLRTPQANRFIDGIETSVTINSFSTFINAVQRINQGGFNTTGLIDYSGVGMMSIHRNGIGTIIGINNTTQTPAFSTSTSLANQNQLLFRAGTNFASHQASFYAMGASLLSENNSLVSAFATYLNSL
jgi:hypothetical protein